MTLIVNRRRFIAGTLGGGAALALGTDRARAQDRELVVITYPGKLSEPHRWLGDQLEARHKGLKVRLVPSDSQDVVAQIKAAQGHSPYDAMPNDEPPHLIGIKEGYIQKVQPQALKNYANLVGSLVQLGQGYGVPATYSLVGIAYNTQLVKTAPTAWTDLWRPEFADLIGIARTSSNLGLATLAIAAKSFGGSEDDLQIGWEKLKALKPKAARSPAILTQMLERGEIGVAPLWSNNTAAAAEKGLPIAFAKPLPGPVAIVSFFAAITGTAHADLVNEWLDGIVSRDYQQMAAAAPYYFGPTVRDVAVPASAAPYTPATPEEIRVLQTIDWTKIVPQRPALVEAFDRNFSM
jgi:putative spermidine/putrescine transport system substrate-binding protein